MTAADRYLRTGELMMPTIYHGTQAHLKQAVKDAQLASYRYSGEHFLEAVYAGERVVLQVYQDGECTWNAGEA